MDKKNTIIGLLFIAAAFYFMYKGGEQQKQLRDAQQQQRVQQIANVQEQTAVQSQPQTAASTDEQEEKIFTLENEHIRVVFTNKGAAIKKVELLKFKQTQENDDPYVFNDTEKMLALGLALEKTSSEIPILFQKGFSLVEATADKIIFRYEEADKFRITRAFAINIKDKDSAKPYLIEVYTKIENLSNEETSSKTVFISLGMASPNAGDIYGNNLAFGLYDGTDSKFKKASIFVDSSGVLGIGATKAKSVEILGMERPSVWGAVKNQFFTSIFTPNVKSGYGVLIPIVVNESAGQKFMKSGVAGFMSFELSGMAAGESASIEGSYYVGPKELSTLLSLGNRQDLVMDFGWAAFVSKPLLMLLEFLNSIFERVSPNWSWGWAIIALTVIVRACMWPLTVMQIRSSQRMMKLQGPIKEINEKYKNDPQKKSQETMKLYGEYNVKPLAGCFPVLIQLPIFLGLYYMLQSSGDIRFGHFLWITDLSLPDTIPGHETIFGFPLHILPIINALITYVNMHIMPMPNAQKSQRVMIKLMPFIMLFFFYTFPSGLVLYWTVQSMIGVVQAIIVVRTKDSVVIKKRDTSKPTFMQKMQKLADEAQQRQNERAKGTLHEKRKANPGGRSTPPKRK